LLIAVLIIILYLTVSVLRESRITLLQEDELDLEVTWVWHCDWSWL